MISDYAKEWTEEEKDEFVSWFPEIGDEESSAPLCCPWYYYQDKILGITIKDKFDYFWDNYAVEYLNAQKENEL